MNIYYVKTVSHIAKSSYAQVGFWATFLGFTKPPSWVSLTPDQVKMLEIATARILDGTITDKNLGDMFLYLMEKCDKRRTSPLIASPKDAVNAIQTMFCNVVKSFPCGLVKNQSSPSLVST